MPLAALANVRIVLSRPSHPGNVGAAARAMRTMGLADLRLVAPQRTAANAEARRATHGRDVLEAARVHERLEDALADCVAAYALSARRREWAPELTDLRSAAPDALARAARGPVAFVFGNETSGLSNTELLLCQQHVLIPADPAASSLNLAQAVQVVAYELRLAALEGAAPESADGGMPATVADLEGLYRHLDEAGAACGFFDSAGGSNLPVRWRRLFARARPEREEVNILRGLLRALQASRRDGGNS
jgi:TrmH family RNA methyltransferase